MSASNSKGTVILGGTESDSHVVSIFLCALMLEEEGYDVVNLGCMCPAAELFGNHGIDGLIVAHVVCNQNGHALEDLRLAMTAKRTDAPIILGGHYTLGCHDKAAQQRQLRQCGIDLFVESLDALVGVLNGIAANRSTANDQSRATDRPLLSLCQSSRFDVYEPTLLQGGAR